MPSYYVKMICAERSLASGIVQGLECSSSSADST